MERILNLMDYQGEKFNNISNEDVRSKMMSIAKNLLPLETEIIQHPDARIVIRQSGIVILDSFPPDLSERMRITFNNG